MSAGSTTKNSELEEALVATNALPENFDTEESVIMVSIAWPILVTRFCKWAMSSVGSAFVGHLSTKTGTYDTDSNHHDAVTFLAAAGLSNMVVNIMVIPPFAFSFSLNALVSQAIGSGQKKMAGSWLQLSLFWLTVGYIPCIFALFYVEQALTFLRFSPEICRLGGAFGKWNALWPIPNGWYQCMRVYFQAQGNTRPAMYNSMIFLCVHILLNWVLVFGGPFRAWHRWEGFGFIGSAMSISCSRSLQALAYWLYMFVYKKAHEETWPGWSLEFLSRRRNMAFLGQCLPGMGTLVLQAAMSQSTTLMISSLGPLAIASSSSTQALTQIFAAGLTDACTAITGIRVGFHLGKDNWPAARRASIIVFRLAAFVVLCIAAVLIPLRHQAAALITNDPQVQNYTAQLLIPVLLQTFAAMIVQCNVGGVFASQGRTRVSTILSMGVELPLTLGIVAFLVFVVKATVLPLYWGQAAVNNNTLDTVFSGMYSLSWMGLRVWPTVLRWLP